MPRFFEFGIDLGTTNSSIARYTDDGVTVFPNRDNMNVTPSVVYIDKRGRVYIGISAKDKIVRNEKDVQREFKRTMGTSQVLHFESSDQTRTPVELSAEILKSLRSDVNAKIDYDLSDIVITVPAAFDTIQCDDTIKAARLAGFTNVLLLQEPIAASLAYGIKPDAKDKYWLVFDFGGGTFDAAVISTHDGRLEVLSHSGDNLLGGKDIDKAIYEQLILPELEAQGFIIDKSAEKALIFECEKLKISLSDRESDRFIIDEDMGILDEEENPAEFEMSITRKQLESVILPFCKRALALCDQSIQDAKISESKLSKILLVGGVTFIPSFRALIKEHFGCPIDVSIDPMTVVAQGAAIYGSSQRVIETEKVVDVTQPFTLTAEYDSITGDTEYNLIGRVVPNGLKKPEYINVRHDSGIWESGWMKLASSGFIDMDLVLVENSINVFEVRVRANDGSEMLITDTIVIRHQKDRLKIMGAPLPHTISVEVVEKGKTVLAPIFEKGITLPAKTTQVFYANHIVNPGTQDALYIKVYEGQILDEPQLNHMLGSLEIKGTQISKRINAGDKIEITMNHDTSRSFTLQAYLVETKSSFSIDIVYEKHNAIDELDDTQKILKDIKTKLGELEESSSVDSDEIEGLQDAHQKISRKVEGLLNMGSETLDEHFDDINKSKAQTKELAVKVNEVYKESKPEMDSEKRDDQLSKLEKFFETFGSAEEKTLYKELRNEYKKAEKEDDESKLDFYLGEMNDLKDRVLFNDIGFLGYYFGQMTNGTLQYTNKTRYNELVSRGRLAINNDDVRGLQKVIGDLYDILDQSDSASGEFKSNMPSGIRR